MLELPFISQINDKKMEAPMSINIKQERPPVATMGFAVVQRTAYGLPQQVEACQEGYYDLVAALVGVSAKISPSDQVLFQSFHETVPEY